MIEDAPTNASFGRMVALLRLALVAVFAINEHLLDSPYVDHLPFDLTLILAGTYAGLRLVLEISRRETELPRHLAPCIALPLLLGLTYFSGGSHSSARRAFLVIPLGIAFRERPRLVVKWSLLALVGFTVPSLIHPGGTAPASISLVMANDLYLLWTAAAGVVLAAVLAGRARERTALAEARQRLVVTALESSDRERKRLASTLHDEPVQNLIAARHDLRRARYDGDVDSFERVDEGIQSTLTALREEIFNLHPHVLDHVGLSGALQAMAQRHNKTHPGRVSVNADAAAGTTHELVLFSLAREFLSNAIKHSDADRISVHVSRAGENVILEVQDDGNGIGSNRLQEAIVDGHIGLAAARERLAVLGGELEIQTSGAGTRVVATLPARRMEDWPEDSQTPEAPLLAFEFDSVL